MANTAREELMAELLFHYRNRRRWSVDAISLWKGLCGRYPSKYGLRMPDNLTERALILGVLVS